MAMEQKKVVTLCVHCSRETATLSDDFVIAMDKMEHKC